MTNEVDPARRRPEKRRATKLRRLGEELAIAFGLLTRFPLPKFETTSSASLASSFWAFPIVGASVGVIGAVILALVAITGLGTVPAVIFAMIAMIWVTGALHEDGLADFCDGLGGGKDRSSKLDIMRDSQLGTYGALGLVLGIAAEASLLVEVIALAGLFVATAVVVVVSAVSRFAIALPFYFLKPARSDGLGQLLGKPEIAPLICAAFVSVFMSWVMLGWTGALPVLVGAGLGSGCVTYLAFLYIGGSTGDVFGATVIVAKIVSLVGYILFVLGP